MKATLPKFLIGIAALAVGLQAGAAADLVHDDFNGSTLDPIWRLHQGYASVQGGWVTLSGSTPGTRGGYIVNGEGSTWSDYRLSTHVITDGGGSACAEGPPCAWYVAIVKVRVQTLSGDNRGTYYEIEMWTPASEVTTKRGAYVAILKVVNDEVSVVREDPAPAGAIDDYDNRLDIEVVGQRIQVLVNDQLITDYADQTPNAIMTGGVSLGALWESTARYDYIYVDTATLPGLKEQIPAAEYAALVELYSSTQGADWFQNGGWLDPAAPSWDRVTVSGFFIHNPATGRIPRVGNVTGIDLYRNRLSGAIPDSLGNLVNLQSLDFGRNALSGPIPEALGNLASLRYLALGWNELNGSIPDSLGKLRNLEQLYLHDNQLDGFFSVSLADLVNLQILSLERNHLSGSIPASLGNLVNLHVLNLGANQLSGNIPDFSVIAPFSQLDITYNCFDISPGSQVRTIIDRLLQAGKAVTYDPQNADCAPVAPGDLNNDGCVDRADLSLLMTQIRARSQDLTYDLNGDGKVDIADARFLVVHFTNPGGSSCTP